MKRTIFLTVLLMLTAVVLFAQQLTVAVSTFEARGGLTADEADAITELFIAALVADGMVRVADRNSFDQIVAEMQFQASDWTDKEKTARLGSALKATNIIRGTVMTLAGQTAITSTLLDLNTAEIISSSTLRMQNMNEVFDKMPAFVKEITNFLVTSQTFKIGDTGPGGGIVFFVEGYVRKEATLFLGYGSFSRARETIQGYRGGGYTDWILPSIRDLEHIFEKIQKTGLKNFAIGEKGNFYWSSTAVPRRYSTDLYCLNMVSGQRNDYFGAYDSNSSVCFLAVREF